MAAAMIPGRQPLACNSVTSDRVSGVLPAPPTVMLPTTTTGTGKRRGLASSVQNLSMQLPRAIGPLLGGALFHAGYLALPFYLGAALQLGYLLLFVVFFRDTEAARAPGRHGAG